MRRYCCVLLMWVVTFSAFSQTPSSGYQVGTITAVKAHPKDAEDQDRDVKQYDVSLKVGDSAYVVLYTPPSGANIVEYTAGQNLMVLVGNKSITFSRFGKTVEVPILSSEALPVQSGLDWSRSPSEYFSQKLQHLSDKLSLTQQQQSKIKPILEQEAGEAKEILLNSVLSREDKLNALEKIVRSSDGKMKPILSADQWRTLQNLRKDQKRELKETIAEKAKNR